jgi:hypothetical protein
MSKNRFVHGAQETNTRANAKHMERATIAHLLLLPHPAVGTSNAVLRNGTFGSGVKDRRLRINAITREWHNFVTGTFEREGR